MNKWLNLFTRMLSSATEIQNVLYIGGAENAEIRNYAPRSYWTAICEDVPEDFEPFKKFNDFALDAVNDIPWDLYFDFDVIYMLAELGDLKNTKVNYEKALRECRFLVIESKHDLYGLDDVYMKHDNFYVAAITDTDKDILQSIVGDLG